MLTREIRYGGLCSTMQAIRESAETGRTIQMEYTTMGAALLKAVAVGWQESPPTLDAWGVSELGSWRVQLRMGGAYA